MSVPSLPYATLVPRKGWPTQCEYRKRTSIRYARTAQERAWTGRTGPHSIRYVSTEGRRSIRYAPTARERGWTRDLESGPQGDGEAEGEEEQRVGDEGAVGRRGGKGQAARDEIDDWK
eukprot:2678256-Rhodomonas_salina.1